MACTETETKEAHITSPKKTCHCGNELLPVAIFCEKCGTLYLKSGYTAVITNDETLLTHECETQDMQPFLFLLNKYVLVVRVDEMVVAVQYVPFQVEDCVPSNILQNIEETNIPRTIIANTDPNLNIEPAETVLYIHFSLNLQKLQRILLEHIDELNIYAEQTQQQHAEKIEDLKKKFAKENDYTQKENRLQKEKNVRQTRELNILRTKCEEKEAQQHLYDTLKQDHNTIEKDLRALERKLGEKEKELQNIQKRGIETTEKLQQEINKHTKEKKTLTKEFSESFHKSKEQHEKEVAQLNENIAKCKKENEVLLNKIHGQEVVTGQLRHELKETRESLQRELNAAQEEQKTLMERNTMLENELDRVTQQNRTLSDQMNAQQHPLVVAAPHMEQQHHSHPLIVAAPSAPPVMEQHYEDDYLDEDGTYKMVERRDDIRIPLTFLLRW